ncbi:hypothetical protein [Holospora undulata]|uniref:Transposase n=1 Tax=Holospora undulata HU1 TaxID=1321371 RepID=A0A061JGP2_9PROT|nr:hypothetical protein [Holospora undulata]ETZ05240.1 hypothetical protein K737_300319 [Holospora undulata HU1]
MTKSYSNDLGQRAIEYLDERRAGILKQRTLFKISVSAIDRWYRKPGQEGSYFLKRRVWLRKKD